MVKLLLWTVLMERIFKVEIIKKEKLTFAKKNKQMNKSLLLIKNKFVSVCLYYSLFLLLFLNSCLRFLFS